MQCRVFKLNQQTRKQRERKISFPPRTEYNMIISKDLFLLGEQDYLRLPKDDKRARKSAPTICAQAGMGKIPQEHELR